MSVNPIEVLVLPSIENIDEISIGINAKITNGYYNCIEIIVEDNEVRILHSGRDVKEFSFVWLSSFWATRDLATAVKVYLDRYQVPNTHVEHSSSKLTDTVNFINAGIQYPNTYYVDGSKLIDNVVQIEGVCRYPLIMKDTKGCGGMNSVLINSRKELIKSIGDRNKARRYFFQQYIANEYDWGVLVSNGNVVSGERSYAANGEFRNNSCVGAREEFVSVDLIPKSIKEMALASCESLDLLWSRADIIVDRENGMEYLLEVNRFPGITGGSDEVTAARNFLIRTSGANERVTKHSKTLSYPNKPNTYPLL